MSLEPWANGRTSDIRVGRTNKQSGGQSLGPACTSVADFTLSLTSQDKVETTHGERRIGFRLIYWVFPLQELLRMDIGFHIATNRKVGESEFEMSKE